MCRITAVVTNYNKPPDVLRRCIDSIESSGVPYIIVDDSSDDTRHLSQYSNVVLLGRNVGPYRAFEAGLDLVESEYVMRVDADDYITGAPEVDGSYDAYINNIDGKITLKPERFVERPYAGMNGAVVKTGVMRDVWGADLKYCFDIVIFARLITKYRCVLNQRNHYVYDRSYSDVTKIDDRGLWVKLARSLCKKEIERNSNGQICRA